MKKSYENLLASYIDALHPIIYINHFDSNMIDEILLNIGQDVKFIEYNNALGVVDFKTKSQMHECDLEQFLFNTIDEGYNQQTFIVLKDVHNYLENYITRRGL